MRKPKNKKGFLYEYSFGEYKLWGGFEFHKMMQEALQKEYEKQCGNVQNANQSKLKN